MLRWFIYTPSQKFCLRGYNYWYIIFLILNGTLHSLQYKCWIDKINYHWPEMKLIFTHSILKLMPTNIINETKVSADRFIWQIYIRMLCSLLLPPEQVQTPRQWLTCLPSRRQSLMTAVCVDICSFWCVKNRPILGFPCLPTTIKKWIILFVFSGFNHMGQNLIAETYFTVKIIYFL